MKVNWKARFKNKTFVITFYTVVLSFVYTILGMFDIVPPVTQDMVAQLILAIVQILAGLGVVVDPTTKGASDSDRAMTYYKD